VWVIANGMKTAISLPDDVYHEAERHAKRTRKSRSQLYAEALAEYLARHAPDEVTERMNQVLDELGEPGLDPFLAGAARRVLKDVEW
jgi:succinate dehydrogenase/fumarate reductase flavoprotein subunit